MEEFIKRALLLALIVGIASGIRWVAWRFLPNQARWLNEHLGDRQRKLAGILCLFGMLLFISVAVVKVVILRSHEFSWPWELMFWTGVGIVCAGILLGFLEAMFGGNQGTPQKKPQKQETLP
ncbi:hypothetical protein [Roseimicrobium sp. ORNL1]|uniref:hypothetical protein n=1 Tax=Roseimicrobium sp. ORNL1 TaxID=2711231 RepID=UPI0013E174FC|nr:hypothetical protein [Roseimicrobium sp. ORNL1]QIF01550.1 hypothetical protein G5S37_08445 [Roseimicrobium sp. ORNL1]